MWGRNVLPNNTGGQTRVSADGQPEFKAGGVTIDWTTVVALGADTTQVDGGVFLAGQKILRFGQVVTKITASGKFGPYDPAAADGRQLMAPGNIFVLDETVTEFSAGIQQLSVRQDQVGLCIEGGAVWIDKVLHSGVAAASLALGPTLATLLAALPRLRPVRD